ncbi:MAG: hypothetical protein OEM25_01815 [Gammaproteobacteria bacterium]|nr:hypothetical protein [Gammaproteobacteria bacterium]
MASAERLLNDAQYAFQSITVGESRQNRRNAARAKSLCKKIFKKYPGSSEAVVAHNIMMRLGEEAFTSDLGTRHRHSEQHMFKSESSQPRLPASRGRTLHDKETVEFDWRGLGSVVLATPRLVLAVLGIAGAFLFGVFGPLLFLPLIALVLLTGPFRQMLKPRQRHILNELITRANAYIAEKRKSGTGLT